MITLTKLNGEQFVLNCDLIESYYGKSGYDHSADERQTSACPGTKKEQVVNKVVEFKRKHVSGTAG